MLSVENISVKRARSHKSTREQFLALDDVSFTLPAAKTLAVVGESGAGKSTLIAAILNLLKPFSGAITWCAEPMSIGTASLVMQEPRAAFNPALSIRQSVMEPIVASGKSLPDGQLKYLCEKLELPLDLLTRRPHEISIGQAQRAGILRALINVPPLVLFDEPLSALDAITQKHSARLIANLQAEHGFAALIVTHDLGYAVAFSDEIVVLRAGRIEEITKAKDFLQAPRSEYGNTLRDAAVALGALESSA
jgi:peptide/nickel transport system ATP-binding protein